MKNSIQIKAADTLKAAHGYSASVVRLRNTSAVSIDYSVSGGNAVELAAGASAVVDVAALTSEISVRRTDLSATPVNVMLEFGLDPDEAYVFAVENATGSITSATASATASVLAHNASAAAHLNIVRRTLSGNLVLTAADLPQQKIIPDADRNVTLPAESTAQWMFEICHGGAAYVITLKRAGGTTVASLISGAPVVVAWDGVAFGIC